MQLYGISLDKQRGARTHKKDLKLEAAVTFSSSGDRVVLHHRLHQMRFSSDASALVGGRLLLQPSTASLCSSFPPFMRCRHRRRRL